MTALRITAGGGGRLPTHGEIEKAFVSDRDSDPPKSYPDPKKSRELCNRNIPSGLKDGFPRKNWQFGILTLLYLLTAWFMLSGIGESGVSVCSITLTKPSINWRPSIRSRPERRRTSWRSEEFVESGCRRLGALFSSPFLAFLVAVVIAGFVAFTDTHKLWYRWVGGTAHATAHLLSPPSSAGWDVGSMSP